MNLSKSWTGNLYGTMLSSLTGCASMMSSKMPAGSVSMEQAYDGAINGTDNANGFKSGSC